MTEKIAEAVTARLPKSVVEEIEKLAKIDQTDRSTEIRLLLEIGLFEKKKKLAVERYKNGKTTIPEAARELNVTIWEMIEIFKDEKVEAQYDIEDLRRDLEEMKL